MGTIGTIDHDGGDVSAQPALVRGLKNDRKEDTRSCRHDDCHGTLGLTKDDIVICHDCRCTPNGIFFPPDQHDQPTIEQGHRRYTYFRGIDVIEGGVSASDPWGQRAEDRHPRRSPDRYDGSGRVRLAGGYEAPYDEDDDHRPNGVTDEYTFDLSTL